METESALHIAAVLTVVIGIVHSYLGERYILIRLFRREDLPKLFGSPEFTKNTLRFVWHLATIAWWGFATLLFLMATQPITAKSVGLIIGLTFLVHAVIALLGSRGKHLSWIVFLIIGSLAIYASFSV